jgi:MFS family permease
MATAILPGFLAAIGSPPAALGLIEGVADGISSFVKLGGGWFSDRFGHRKLLAASGYVLTGVSKAVFAFAATWHLVLVGRIVGWFGKGFRGPIRDAMLADSVASEARGKAFGFHRAGDTVGSIVGPLVGVWLLSLWQAEASGDLSQPYRGIFLVTLIPGVLSVLAFLFFVQEKRSTVDRSVRLWGTLRTLPPKLRRLLVGIGLFGIGDMAPTLLILAAIQLMSPAYGLLEAGQLAALMYVVRNITYALASYPIGAISDRIGRIGLLAAGYVLGALTLAGFTLAFALSWSDPAILFLLFAMAGVFIAAEDTLEGAITADLVPQQTRGIGMGVLGTVNGVGDLLSSVLVGSIWTAFSPVMAFAGSVLTMLAGAVMVGVLALRPE